MLVPMALDVGELLIIGVIILVLLFGATKLPQLARALGRAGGEFQKGKLEAEQEVQKMKGDQPAAEPSEHDKLLKAAWELGIPTEGKTDDQIREEVKKAIG
jgi:sec-independent protein translocase protein TatA